VAIGVSSGTVHGRTGVRLRRHGGPASAEPSPAHAALRRTFRSFRRRNFRLYYAGLLVSNVGTWLQLVAQSWLVLKLTDDGRALGIVTALQFLPLLLFGAWGGVVADRTDKRRLIMCTQVLAGLQAAALGLAVVTGIVNVGVVYAASLTLGAVNAIDNPARRSFIGELVAPDELGNAMALNTAVMTTSRIVGPALAGLLIATVGVAGCFLLNAASFAAVLVGLVALRRDELRTPPVAPRRRGQVREGFAYVWHTPTLRLALAMTAVIAVLAFNYQVTLPLLVRRTFGGGPGMFGALLSVTSVGSLAGSLLTASRAAATRRYLVAAAGAFGAAMTALALAPWLWLAFACAVPMGAAGSAFVSTGSAMLQAGARPDLRGRVMALHAVVFLGSTPIGGPVVGTIGQVVGPRAALAVGGASSLITAAVVVGMRTLPARRPAWPGLGAKRPQT
jgi:MFS family permease